ncbi:vWA domain-containing protein [Salipaludibacillus daqingensis]|uniref:vWA domain-containing protein n=1 Tax=Salipaludibacillus daqingensis TaxID=3041001 RepID=UPI00247445B1|nr:VWA domain-containing protein [Salipaludibacillus daqingensis]
MTWRGIFYIGTMILLVSGCSEDENNVEATSADNQNHQANENKLDPENEINEPNETSDSEEFNKVEMDVNAIFTREPGRITKQLHEEEKSFDMNLFEAAIEEEKFNEWSAERAFAFIIDEVGADLDEAIHIIKDYEVIYEDLVLPDGRLLQEIEDDEIEKEMDSDVNVAILIDASGSMEASVDDERKMDLAKDSINHFTGNLPSEVNVMLQVYGHKGTNQTDGKEESCSGIENVYGLSPFDSNAFSDALDSFDANGYTPLAASIAKAKEDLLEKSSEDDTNYVYVISDGIETCGGDPVAEAKAMKDSGIDIEFYIVGFDVEDDEHEQLEQIADVMDGTYTSVYTKQELNDEVTEQWSDQISITSWRFWSGLKGANINFGSAFKGLDVDKLYRKTIEIRNQEDTRIYQSIQAFRSQDEVDDSVVEELESLHEERKELIADHIDEVYENKRDEVSDEADRMRDLIEEISSKHID